MKVYFIDVLCVSRRFFFKMILPTRFFLYIYSIFIAMRIQNKKIIASILFLVVSFVSNAQGEGMPPPPAPPPPPGLPIDGAIFVLFAIALALGIVYKVLLVKRQNA